MIRAREMERVKKEFKVNKYGERFDVQAITVLRALFGEMAERNVKI